MATIDRYRPDDRAAVATLLRRMYGDDRGEVLLRRWSWQYERNPALKDGVPLIWLVRHEGDVIGQYATMPVRLAVHGQEVDAAWGMDVMILPEHQGKGLGRLMFETWDQNVGASIGIGLTDASHGMFKKLQWHDMGRVPRLVKHLGAPAAETRSPATRMSQRVAAVARRLAAPLRPLGGDVRLVRRFDEGATQLWERIGHRFAFAVRRDATYLNWKFADAANATYRIATLVRDGNIQSYVAIRHAEQSGQRVTILSDFLADPDDPSALRPLLRWVEREARWAESDVIRVFATHGGFTRTILDAGYQHGPAAMRMVAKINAMPVSDTYYDSFAAWHVTLGDSDVDFT